MLTNCVNNTLMTYHTYVGYMKPRDAPRMLNEDGNFTAVLELFFCVCVCVAHSQRNRYRERKKYKFRSFDKRLYSFVEKKNLTNIVFKH